MINQVICNSCLPVLRTHFYNVINHVTNHDVKFAHILIPDVASNLTMMTQSLLSKLTVTHRDMVYILFCAKCPNAVYVGDTSNRFRFRLSNHKHSIKHNFSSYPVAMHFNEQSHTIEDLRCIIIKNHVPNMDNRKLIIKKNIIKLKTYYWT